MSAGKVRSAAERAWFPDGAGSTSFVQLKFHADAAGLETLEAELFAAGALSVTLEDAADEPILEPPPGTMPLWSAIRVKALFDSNCDRAAVDSLLQRRSGSPPLDAFEYVADRAWEREWLKDFRPMQFGRRLWVCPGGQHPRAATNALPAVEIELDPGLAFGTGTHPTTALCLEWLDAYALYGKSLIDYGCGSGILAVAALKLGARCALGVDIDPQALIASRANAERNGVADRLRLCDAAAGVPEPADLVIANILAAPLEELAEKLASLVNAGGRLVLSGLLESQAVTVAAHYAPWFDMDAPTARDSWVRLVGVPRCASQGT